jgi:hypothetical protein
MNRDARGCDGCIRKELAAGVRKKRRVYQPRIVGGQVMLQADFERLHKYLLELERADYISDEMRAVIEDLWPELIQ